jgi:hypothetical protein
MNAMTNSPHTSKSILARALATENIRVEHSPNAATAMFDVANRVLVLPVWKEMSEELHDMFIGHEVAHALYTPYRESDKKIEGAWCSDAERIGGNVFASYVQGIINIVEDVRIEKLIKDKYPGLRRDFIVGYNELEKKDFFGTNGKNLADFSFGDRINIHFKCGSAMNVPFSDEEMELVNLVDSCKTFEDVISASESVYNHICGQRADHEKEQTPINFTPNPNQNNNNNDQTMTNVVSVQKSDDGDKADKGNTTNTQTKNSDKGENPNNNNNTIGPKNAGSGLAPNDLPKMTTQKKFEENQKSLNDNRCSNVHYYTLGVANPKNIILPYVKSNAILSDHFGKLKTNRNYSQLMGIIENNFNDLIRSTSPLIQVLVKQFEMKKAADIQKRTSVSRSGKIDADRIFKYKVSDDIFLRCAKIAEGKNHGLVLFVDWSASMLNATSDTLNQIIILTRFCKQMNIPFEVYLFSSQYPVLFKHLNLDLNDDSWSKMNQWKDNSRVSQNSHFKGGSSDSDDRMIENFALINILSSQMNKRQFNEALLNVFTLGQMISRPKNTKEGDNLPFVRSSFPDNFGQGNTPLDSTIIAAMTIVPEFQKQTKVQIVNTIFLTDGESGAPAFYNSGHATKSFIRTKFSSKEYIADDETSTDTLLRIFRDVTGSNTIGFYVNSSNYCRYFNDPIQDRKSLRENGFLEATKMKNGNPDYGSYNYETKKYEKFEQTKNHGYDRLFILPCNQEIVEDMEILDNLDNNASLVKIRNAFTKSVEKRGASRSFLNRFADVIANHITR